MNVKITDEIKAQIKELNPLHEVMKDYGFDINAYNKTCCPFHSEKTPSFEIRNEGKTYACYGCGAGREQGQQLILPDGSMIEDAGNDVIGFVQNYLQVSFKEACAVLAERVGIKLPEYKTDPRLEALKDEVTKKNRRFYSVLQKDQDALAYLKKRGIEEEEIKKWRLGMVPWDYPNPRYAGRIVFGLVEAHWNPENAKTIAMAYRVREFDDYAIHGWDFSTEEKIKETLYPKYYNDKTSEIYTKNAFLYGLNEAAKHIRKQRCAVIMEGYTDVIMAHKHGLENSVAACGTSITDGHVETLRKYTDKVFIWLDGDEAGINGTLRALPKFLKAGFKVMIVQSLGMDPDEVAQKGLDLRQFMIQHAKSALQVVIDQVVSDYDQTINQARVKALEHLLPIIDCIQQPAEKANYEAVINQKLGVHL